VIVKTDSAGRFELPPGRDKGLIVVVHESGYGFLTSDDFKGGSRIQLTPWSKIEGTIVSDKTGNKEFVLGISQVIIPEESESQSIRWLFDRTAFSGKEFTINFVPSVPLQIGQIVESGLANTVNIDPKPGQTYKIRFGDKGVVSAEKEQPSLTGKALPE
jgi:hypothetical protein